MDNEKTLQSRLKKTREARGLTQEELAKKSYLSKNTISNVERGITKKLKQNELELLSSALFVTEDYLLGITDYENMTITGKIRAMNIFPKWENWEQEIRQVLKKHSNDRVIETLIRDFIYYLSEIESYDYHKKYEYPGIILLQSIIKIISDEKNNNLNLLIKIIKCFEDENNPSINLLIKIAEAFKEN